LFARPVFSQGFEASDDVDERVYIMAQRGLLLVKEEKRSFQVPREGKVKREREREKGEEER